MKMNLNLMVFILEIIYQNETYIINLDEYADLGTHWIALYVRNNQVIYFDSFGVEHVPKEIKRFIRHKNTKPYKTYKKNIFLFCFV